MKLALYPVLDSGLDHERYLNKIMCIIGTSLCGMDATMKPSRMISRRLVEMMYMIGR